MNLRSALMGFCLLLVVGGGGYLGYRYVVLPRDVECDLCGRPVHSDMKTAILLKDNTHIAACCPRCAFHFDMEKPGQVARINVEDMNTGESIEASKATYIEGSDVTACHPASETDVREPGVQYDLAFDRCLPGLIAFKDPSAAQDFQNQHGGRVLSFVQALESVREH